MKSQAAVVMLSVHKQGFFDTISSLIEPLEFNQLCLYQLVSSEFLGFVGTLVTRTFGPHGCLFLLVQAETQKYKGTIYSLSVWKIRMYHRSPLSCIDTHTNKLTWSATHHNLLHSLHFYWFLSSFPYGSECSAARGRFPPQIDPTTPLQSVSNNTCFRTNAEKKKVLVLWWVMLRKNGKIRHHKLIFSPEIDIPQWKTYQCQLRNMRKTVILKWSPRAK